MSPARRTAPPAPFSPYVFLSERGAPLTPAGFRKTLARIGEASTLPFPVHPHMLRHACGFKLANDEPNMCLRPGCFY